jgi:uncharacterized protein
VSGRTRKRLTVHAHARARTERLEWDGSTLQLWVREPPADGRANAAVTRAVARWAGVAPSQVAIVSGAAARHKLVEIQREDALPPPGCLTGSAPRHPEQTATCARWSPDVETNVLEVKRRLLLVTPRPKET